jgi:hypothetical protein
LSKRLANSDLAVIGWTGIGPINSEDVQDALIEDYFRYNDLSRMEADDILMNISEIESPNYEYVELDLLNLPRDLSTNLNEDSDNQKENVVPS